MMRRFTRISIYTVIAALLVTACGDADVTEPPQPPTGERPVASVTLSPNPASVAVGRTLQLTALTRDRDGTPLEGRAVSWSSSDASVATVSETGVVTGVGTGNAMITASSEPADGTAAVTVTATPTGGTQLTWVGGGTRGSDWSVAANWSPAAVPGAADTVRIATASSSPVLSRNVEVARLILAGGTLRTGGYTLAIRQPRTGE